MTFLALDAPRSLPQVLGSLAIFHKYMARALIGIKVRASASTINPEKSGTRVGLTNRGELLIIEGRFQNGEMVLSGVDHAKGGHTLVRGSWKPVNDGVRETAVTSSDGGKTWKPWFDLVFRPHKP